MSARDDIRAKRRRASRHRLWLRRTGNGASITVDGDTLTIRSYRGDSRMRDWGLPPLHVLIHMSEVGLHGGNCPCTACLILDGVLKP